MMRAMVLLAALLAGRIPIQLSPGQSLLILAVAGGLLLALLALGVLEAGFNRVLSAILRLSGHQPPRKSSFRTALDELEARLQERRK